MSIVQEFMSVYDVGANIHTALRKCCDNKQTSILYNAIEILPKEVWLDYCEMVKDIFIKWRHAESRGVALEVRNASHKYDFGHRLHERNPHKHQTYWQRASTATKCKINIFECTLTLCNIDDFENMLSFITELK